MRIRCASSAPRPESSRRARTETRARDDELRRFTATLGPVTWWTALGRDAATLARVTARQLPNDSASEPRDVTERRTPPATYSPQSTPRLWYHRDQWLHGGAHHEANRMRRGRSSTFGGRSVAPTIFVHIAVDGPQPVGSGRGPVDETAALSPVSRP